MTNKVECLRKAIKEAKLIAQSETTAWSIVYALLGELEVYFDEYKSKRAGYDIYSSSEHNGYVCNLGNRIEINFPDGSTKNVWIYN